MPESRARVTALLTTYRPRFDYLEAALRSALAQEEVAVEVLVSDSGSDDAVREFVLGFGPQVRYRSNATPQNAAGNHRLAIAEVRTPYVALLGHDDLWEPGFLAALVPPLDADPHCVLAFSDHWFIDPAGRIDHPLTERMTAHWGRAARTTGVQHDVLDLLAAQTMPLAMAAVLRTEVAQAHPIPDASGPAYDIWLAYAMAVLGRPAWYDARRLTQWRFHPAGGTSLGNPDWYAGGAFTWDAVLADERCAPIHAIARQRGATSWRSLARTLVRRGERPAEARAALTRAASLAPIPADRLLRAALALSPAATTTAVRLFDAVRRVI